MYILPCARFRNNNINNINIISVDDLITNIAYYTDLANNSHDILLLNKIKFMGTRENGYST